MVMLKHALQLYKKKGTNKQNPKSEKNMVKGLKGIYKWQQLLNI